MSNATVVNDVTFAGLSTFIEQPNIPVSAAAGTTPLAVAYDTTSGEFIIPTGALVVNGLNLASGAVAGKVLTSDSSGNGTWDPAYPSNYVLGANTFSQSLISSGFTGTANVMKQSGVQTTSETPTVVASINLPINTVMILKGTIIGSDTTFDSVCGGWFTATLSNGNSTLQIIDSAYRIVNATASATFTVTVTNPTTVNVVVTADQTTAYNWLCTYEYQILTTNA